MLQDHVRHLEEKLQMLCAQLIEPHCSESEHSRTEAEIQVAERGLTGYCAALRRKRGLA